LRRYVHLGTGNYHPRTARLYTDYGLFTCDNTIGVDVQKIFHMLTAPGRAGKLKKLLQSPFTMHSTILELIERETRRARSGLPARIIAKMNALSEMQTINALYEASQAGVKIDLIIRGVCALRPGLAGISENIRVRSIVGRFLEHARVFYFHNDGDDEIYLSSADWMGRNFFNRIETCFLVEDKRLHQRIMKECMNNYLADNTRAWLLRSDGTYARVKPGSAQPRDAQQILLKDLAGN
jgi:polyphosphate kinase